MGLVGDGNIHGYHCGCDNCSFSLSRYPLRVQRDSTCSGEVISSPFSNWFSGVSVMSALQTAALEVDAEPGMNAGLHVHVDMSDTELQHKADVVWSFALWEPFLTELAKGRFTYLRGMNMPSRRLLRGFRAWFNLDTTPDYNRLDAYNAYRVQDRHSNLNVRTNYNTFEFRIWNSTRSAWRMELAARLSVALANRHVATSLIANNPRFREDPYSGLVNVITDDTVNTFKAALRAGRQGACIDLLDRQLRYIREGRPTDLEFTAA